MHRSLALGVLAAVSIALASGCGAGSSSSSLNPPTEAQHRDVARCAVHDLVVYDSGKKSSIGSGGTIYSELRIANRSRRACIFSGVPTLVAINRKGNVVDVARKRPDLRPTDRNPHRVVVLEPQGSAGFLIAHYDGIGAGRCRFTTSHALRIRLPGAQHTQTLSYGLQFCPEPNAGLGLQVGRVE